MQGAWVQLLVGELDPTGHNSEFDAASKRVPRAATKTWCSQINKYILKTESSCPSTNISLPHSPLPWQLPLIFVSPRYAPQRNRNIYPLKNL